MTIDAHPRGRAWFFTSAADISSLSLDCAWDARGLATAKRKSKDSVFARKFNSSDSAWTLIQGSGTSIGIVPDPDIDPLIGTVLDLQANTVGQAAGCQRVMPNNVPDSFGVATVTKLCTVGSNREDALEWQVHTANGRICKWRCYDMNVDAWLDGAWKSIGHWGGPTVYTEEWIHWTWDGSKYHVTLHCGTAPYTTGDVNGTVPSGGTPNLLCLQQLSATAGRQSKVCLVEVGTSQHTSEMIWCSPAIEVEHSPTVGYVTLEVENVSTDIVLNSNFKVYIAKDQDSSGQPVWQQVTLWAEDNNNPWPNVGVLDPWKDTVEMRGYANFPVGTGKAVRMYAWHPGGVFFPLKSAKIRVEYP